MRRSVAGAALLVTLTGSLPLGPTPSPRAGCGIFDGEYVIIEFRVIGGGSATESSGRVITIQDDFEGEVHLSRKEDQDCASFDEFLPYSLTHHESSVGADGASSTIDLAGVTAPKAASANGGVNPISGTWNLGVLGFWDGTEVQVPSRDVKDRTPFTAPLQRFPWAPEGEGVLIPNLPIPSGDQDQAIIQRVIESRAWPSIRWTATIKVRRTAPPRIDPCYLQGSSIGCEDQTLGESVPLTGLPFQLHYRSDRFGTPATAKGWTPKRLSTGGWSLAIHHSWSPEDKTLYLGDGTTRSGPSVRTLPAGSAGPAGAFFIAGQGGGEAFLFDASGRHLKTVGTATGALRYEFSYLPSGALSAVSDPFDRRVTIERDGADRPVALIAPNGDRTTLAVNPAGWLARVTNPIGGSYALEYSAEGRLAALTDPLQQVHRYTYGAEGRLVRDAAPGTSLTLTRTPSEAGTAVSVADPTGSTTAFSSGNGGRLRTIRFPDGSSTVSERSGSETQTTMPDGATFSSEASADPIWGRVGPVSSLTFSTPGGISRALETTIRVTGATSTSPFSAKTRETQTSVDGQAFRAIYSNEERSYTLTTPVGRVYSTRYDERGVPLAYSRSGIAPIRLTHDGQGRITEARSGEGEAERRIQYAYDEKGRLRTVTDALGQAHGFGYDGLNRLTSRTTGGAETRYQYDALGRPTSIQPAGKPEHRMTYSATGSLASYTPPLTGAVPAKVGYAYTAAGQLASMTRLDGKTVALTRNAAGQIISAATATGVLRIVRDATAAQVSSRSSPSGVATAFTYDGPLRTAVSYSGGITGKVEMRYGSSARLEGVALAGASEFAYSYDADGLLTGAGEQTFTRDPESGLLTASALRGLTAEWSYNSFGEATAHTELVDGKPLYAVTYARDALGRIVSKTETIGGEAGVEEYRYDAAGRLTRMLRDQQEAARYEYDPNGNRTSAVYPEGTVAAVYDDQDRLLKSGAGSFAWTAHGELLTATEGGATTSFTFDDLSELRGVRLRTGRVIEYLTDADGRRVGRKVGGLLQDAYLRDAEGSLVAWYGPAGALRASFVYGRRAHVPEYMIQREAVFRLVTDQTGSVRLVVNAQTGEVAQRIDYDPFGRILKNTRPGFQPFGFAGGLLDADTGMLRFGVRDYDPETGRWTSKDPIYFKSGTTNFYAYAGNDPVNRSDPAGLWGIEVSFGFVGGGLTWQPGVGISGSVTIGTGTPGVTVTPGGEAYVPADAESADFWSRDTKVTVEAEVTAGFGAYGGVSFTAGIEQATDKYGIRCGPWQSTKPKLEFCALGVCADTEGQTKADVGSMVESGEKPAPKAGVSAKVGTKLEFLIMSTR